jgi:nitric oxide reductase large subunit
LFGFTVMIVGGMLMCRSRAPIPQRVTSPDGATIFTAAPIQNGQDLFRKRGLMDYATGSPQKMWPVCASTWRAPR